MKLTFFEHWTLGRIANLGWPQRRGLIRKHNVVDAAVLHFALDESVRMAVAIGGTYPRDALNLLTELSIALSGSSTKASVDATIDHFRSVAAARAAALDVQPVWWRFESFWPQGAVSPLVIEYQEYDGEFLDWESEVLSGPLSSLVSNCPAWALAWALDDPSQAISALEWNDPRIARILDTAGSPQSTLEELFGTCRAAIDEYEAKMGILPQYDELA